MTEFSIRSDAIDVEQIMRQIRARIREKRGVDYTEEEIRELANVKLERFLDPRKVRSDLVEHYREQRPIGGFELPADLFDRAKPPRETTKLPESYEFDAGSIYFSSRGGVGGLLGLFRRVLNPILKLFINPTPILHAINLQRRFNEDVVRQVQAELERQSERIEALRKDLADPLVPRVVQRFAVIEELETLKYEMLNNLVVEMTRVGIESKNLKMRVESLMSRLDFDERRARALEGVVQYKPGATAPTPAPEPAAASESAAGAGEDARPGQTRKRRRRRRGRRRPGEGPHAPPAEPAAGRAAAPGVDAPTPPEPADVTPPSEPAPSGRADREPPPGDEGSTTREP